MTDLQKFLYILPDVAYIAQAAPGKQEHTFSIQSFRQINGEFIDEDENLLSDNIDKLLAKIDSGDYYLILPDFLFTNTIVGINETSEPKINSYLKSEFLPDQELRETTHQIETFILTQHHNKSKVQISALENGLLKTIAESAKEHKLNILGIASLSWSIKSVISLEPSISVVQMGSSLYVALHYIGVDQTTIAKVTEMENVAETIKTLKGSEPSIQTVYLLTNELVTENLKQHVSSTLPLQQLASFKETDSQMPSYVKQVIEAGMKSVDIKEYHVPVFKLESIAQEKTEEKVEEKMLAPDEVKDQEAEAPKAELPKPTALSPVLANEPEEPVKTPISLQNIQAIPITAKEPEPPIGHQTQTESNVIDSSQKEEDSNIIAQFANHEAKPITEEKPTMTEPERAVIKNPSNFNGLFKMIFITLTVFFITIAAGVGIGLGILSLANKNAQEPLPSPTPPPVAGQATPAPTPTPTPVATDSAKINKEKTTILVANATSIAGHAGDTKKKLETAGFKKVSAANAKDKYEAGTYILMKEKDSELIAMLESITKLSLSFKDSTTTEDPKGQYDVIIVLAE